MGSMGHKTRDPTPSEIKKLCAEFQARWTPLEMKNRTGTDEPTWSPPSCSVDEEEGSPEAGPPTRS